MLSLTRRSLLLSSAAAGLARVSAARLPIRKAVEFNMLPKADTRSPMRFAIARQAGFEAIECPTTPDPSACEEMLAASRKAGLPVHSVMNQEHWRSPLSSADPAVVEKSMEGIRASLHNAIFGLRTQCCWFRLW